MQGNYLSSADKFTWNGGILYWRSVRVYLHWSLLWLITKLSCFEWWVCADRIYCTCIVCTCRPWSTSTSIESETMTSLFNFVGSGHCRASRLSSAHEQDWATACRRCSSCPPRNHACQFWPITYLGPKICDAESTPWQHRIFGIISGSGAREETRSDDV